MTINDDSNGWGATFHRHTFSNEIHRDGGPECTSERTPREVYVFDPDFLREHDEAVKADAWDEGIRAKSNTSSVSDETWLTLNPYRQRNA